MLYVMDLLGVAVFAVTGALAAGRKRMDGIGVGVLALVTAIGGGTLRDLLLGRKVFWVEDQTYLIVIVTAAVATMATARFWPSIEKPLVVADAVGLGLFAVIGAQRALEAGAPPLVVVFMGMTTGAAGGILRDVLCGEMPYVFRGELYATAAIAGCMLMLILIWARADARVAAAAGVALCVAVRLAAIRWGLRLPVFHLKRSSQENEGDAP